MSSVAPPGLHDSPEIHDRDAIADVADHREIMADEEHREPEALAQAHDQVDDLGLDRDVESRHRLVRDDEFRVQREGAGNRDALALAARELMRVARRGGLGQAHETNELDDTDGALGARPDLVDVERFADDRFDLVSRVEGAERVLEDDLHVAAPSLEAGLPQRQ